MQRLIPRGAGLHLGALLGYVLVALVYSWPLLLHLGTTLTGPPDGDTGVYVWNQWVFGHELLVHGRLPYFTDLIFSLSADDANLSLHNYTAFQDVLAMALMPWLGVIATFNTIFLSMSVLTSYSTFLLARHVTARSAESWLAGLLFAWSPVLVTRGMGHFSLVAAAPLAIFLLVLLKADGHERFRDAVALGAIVAWAASAEAYYGVYCLLIGAMFLVARILAIESSPRSGRAVAVKWALNVMLFCVAGLVAAVAASGGGSLRIMGIAVSVRGLYTPMLVLTTLATIRALWQVRARLKPTASADAWHLVRLTLATGLVATVLLSPVLYAVGVRIANAGFTIDTPYWRSSPDGVDVLAFVLPNPNHPLAPASLAGWLASRPSGYIENVASIPMTVVIGLIVAWRKGWRPSLWWATFTLAFGALALGPFVHIGGLNTYIPGPWALLRYMPVLGLARSPTRFSVVMMLGVVVVFVTALEWMGRSYPRRRRLLLGATAILLFTELLPAPITLYSAAVPSFYRQVATAPGDVRVLELPTGVSDGTSSVGGFSARYQFFQTVHGKPLIGGYLSRVSPRRISELRDVDMIDALIALSGGGRLSESREASLVRSGSAFIREANLGFVVIDGVRAPPALVDFAVRAFQLEVVARDESLVLYRPKAGATPPSPERDDARDDGRTRAVPGEQRATPRTSASTAAR